MEIIEDELKWNEFLGRHGYISCHPIGYGSFGDVFAVKTSSKQEDTNYALKRIVSRRNILEDDYAMMEIQSLLHLHHTNIIPIQEVFLSKRIACIVMELAPLGNLEMFVKTPGNPMPSIFIKTIFSQILSAIDYCHSFNLAHRDLNPSNVLVFSLYLVKLADFGLCFQCKNEDTGDSLLCSDYLGHDAYLAPEVRLCKPYHPMPADMWSLGCVLRFLATNSHCLHNSSLLTSQDNHPLKAPDALGGSVFNNKPFAEETEMVFSRNDSQASGANCVLAQVSSRELPSAAITDDHIVECFIEKLCQDVPVDRLTANEAVTEWGHDIDGLNCKDPVMEVGAVSSAEPATEE